jgi:hypothetical protein
MERASAKAFVHEDNGQTQVAVDAVPEPNAVTVTSYPFTSATGVALEDMSSGTTQLVAAN